MDDNSTIVSSAASTLFTPLFHARTGINQPTLETPPISTQSSPERYEAEPFQGLCKQPETTQSPTSSPMRLRLTAPHSSPTAIKLLPSNRAAKKAPLKNRWRNPAAKARRANKVWVFKNLLGNWGSATNNKHKAQWLREQYACGRWIAAMTDSAPVGLGEEAGRELDDASWEMHPFRWGYEVTPEEALGG